MALIVKFVAPAQLRLLSVGLGVVVALNLGMGSQAPAAEPAATETIVLIRHAEKPAAGLGQLNCQGLNRALALPKVINKMFGRPDLIVAPDPAHSKEDSGRPYNYVRPLATIEPTAIVFGLPVDASIGVSDVDALRSKIEAHRGALVLVAWEHAVLAKLARLLIADHGGDPATVPDWQGSDFDSIYVIKIVQSPPSVTFEHLHEGLDNQPATCPE